MTNVEGLPLEDPFEFESLPVQDDNAKGVLEVLFPQKSDEDPENHASGVEELAEKGAN
jgi:hypothetical protein